MPLTQAQEMMQVLLPEDVLGPSPAAKETRDFARRFPDWVALSLDGLPPPFVQRKHAGRPSFLSSPILARSLWVCSGDGVWNRFA
jgi:hypothetical protein